MLTLLTLQKSPFAEFESDDDTVAIEPVKSIDVSDSPAMAPIRVETSDSDTDDDMHSRNTTGNIPHHWYDDEDHVGYNLDGKKVPLNYHYIIHMCLTQLCFKFPRLTTSIICLLIF